MLVIEGDIGDDKEDENEAGDDGDGEDRISSDDMERESMEASIPVVSAEVTKYEDEDESSADNEVEVEVEDGESSEECIVVTGRPPTARKKQQTRNAIMKTHLISFKSSISESKDLQYHWVSATRAQARPRFVHRHLAKQSVRRQWHPK